MDDKLDLIKEIEGFRTVEADWDGEGAVKPKNESIEEALIFLEEMPYEFPLPDVCLDPNGPVIFYWNEEEHGFRAYVDILGDGRIAYFMVEGDRREKGIVPLPGKRDGRDTDTTPEKKGRDKKKDPKK
jgi:hypothetical protein